MTRRLERESFDVTVIREDETIREAAERLAKDDVGVLPITDDKTRIKGILTDRDIVHVVARGKDPNTTRAREMEQGEIVTLRPDDSIERARELMAEHQIRRLPVVEDGRVVAAEAVGRMLTEISKE